jgi:hypothetical protein
MQFVQCICNSAADVAAQTGDVDYMKAMRNVWEDVVYRNMYITVEYGQQGVMKDLVLIMICRMNRLIVKLAQVLEWFSGISE